MAEVGDGEKAVVVFALWELRLLMRLGLGGSAARSDGCHPRRRWAAAALPPNRAVRGGLTVRRAAAALRWERALVHVPAQHACRRRWHIRSRAAPRPLARHWSRSSFAVTGCTQVCPSSRRYVLTGFFDSDRNGGVLTEKLEEADGLGAGGAARSLPLPTCTGLPLRQLPLPWTQHLRARCV